MREYLEFFSDLDITIHLANTSGDEKELRKTFKLTYSPPVSSSSAISDLFTRESHNTQTQIRDIHPSLIVRKNRRDRLRAGQSLCPLDPHTRALRFEYSPNKTLLVD